MILLNVIDGSKRMYRRKKSRRNGKKVSGVARTIAAIVKESRWVVYLRQQWLTWWASPDVTDHLHETSFGIGSSFLAARSSSESLDIMSVSSACSPFRPPRTTRTFRRSS